MQVQTIQNIPLNRKMHPLVHQLFPQYVGIMRPHVGHKMIVAVEQGIPIVKCAECNQAITGKFYNPHVLECIAQHMGCELRCEARGHEVYVSCTCGKDIVGSTPF